MLAAVLVQHFIMGRKIQITKFFLFLYVLTIFSCKTNNKIDTRKIFEKATFNDSLSYYFPPILNDTFEPRRPEYKNFEQNWFSSSLFAFKEPILFNSTDSQTIYRILWLRSFHKPVCFTAKEYLGEYYLNSKTLDRQPEFIPTVELISRDKKTGIEILDTINKGDRYAFIDFDKIKKLKSGQWSEIENFLSRINFWNSPYSDSSSEDASDGSIFVIEGQKDNKYHFISVRNSKKELIRFVKFLIKTSGLNIEKKDVY
jgi:hypothetical protein